MLAKNPALHGLYLITESGIADTAQLLAQVQKAILGGGRLLQYRDKSLPYALRCQQAASLLELCRKAGIPLLINDDVKLAQAVGADGVHLGREDMTPLAARHILGEKALVGVSCYNTLDHALAVEGVDYLAFGRFFPSPTKPNAALASRDLLTEAKAKLAIPIVAIGGITPENGQSLVASGADMLAVVSGVFGATDPGQAARDYQALFL